MSEPQRTDGNVRAPGGAFGARRGRPGRSNDGSGQGDQHSGNELVEKVVFINRSAKVVKGGRRFSFSALVVAGDKRGKVGIGLGKGGEVSDAIRKGGDSAKSQMISIAIKLATIPHEINFEFGGAKVLLRPASPGTGVIAGKTVRAILEAVGIKDVLTKSLGSNNPSNVVKATLGALKKLRLAEDIYRSRGIERRPSSGETVATN